MWRDERSGKSGIRSWYSMELGDKLLKAEEILAAKSEIGSE